MGLQKTPEGENSSLVDQLMLNDSKMWKGGYIHTHTHTHTHTLYTVCALQWLSATKCRETSQHLLICLWFVCRSEEHLPSAIDEQPPHGPEVQEDLCCAVCQGNTLKQYRPL